jgi:hypothetical protein
MVFRINKLLKNRYFIFYILVSIFIFLSCLEIIPAIKIKKYQLIMAAILLYRAVLGPVGSARYILLTYPLLTLLFIEGWDKLLNGKKNEDFIIE